MALQAPETVVTAEQAVILAELGFEGASDGSYTQHWKDMEYYYRPDSYPPYYEYWNEASKVPAFLIEDAKEYL